MSKRERKKGQSQIENNLALPKVPYYRFDLTQWLSDPEGGVGHLNLGSICEAPEVQEVKFICRSLEENGVKGIVLGLRHSRFRDGDEADGGLIGVAFTELRHHRATLEQAFNERLLQSEEYAPHVYGAHQELHINHIDLCWEPQDVAASLQILTDRRLFPVVMIVLNGAQSQVHVAHQSKDGGGNKGF